MQTTAKLLMVRPANFAFNEQTAENNQFQQKSDQTQVAEKALMEFDALVKLLKANDVDVVVVQDTPEPWTPDSVFPNNWFSSHFEGAGFVSYVCRKQKIGKEGECFESS